VHRLEDLIFAPSWNRGLPGPSDTVFVGPSDLNPDPDPDPVQRVAHGVFAVHGATSATFTAFAITRDGLALASGVPVREQRLWGRFHDGADRPVRILRALNDVMLLQVKCDVPCATVPWSDTAAAPEREQVFILGGPRFAGDPIYLAYGRLGEPAVEGTGLDIDGDLEGGEPVSRLDGVVVALVANGRAIALGAAFGRLGIAVAPTAAHSAPPR